MTHILYNPLSNNEKGKVGALAAEAACPFNDGFVETDVTSIDLPEYLASVAAEDHLILTGGDGTINHLVNDLNGRELPRPVYYFPSGNGNDFFKDVEDKAENGMILLNDYVKNLPVVRVNGITKRFLNGIGYGIDGYCSEEGDRQKETGVTEINYSGIAVKGLLSAYTPTNATVTVDGETKEYSRVWLAPTMKGRYYGGGIMIAPTQDRLDPDGSVSFATVFGYHRIRTLLFFPKVIKGEHLSDTAHTALIKGHRIKVAFDRPTPLQIDGETVKNVSEYEVISGS